jgi:hypothetical protein
VLSAAATERLLVPFQALRRDREGEIVWVVDGEGRAHRRAVRSGLRIADGIEILDGVAPGEQLIVRGFLGLVENKSVKAVAD